MARREPDRKAYSSRSRNATEPASVDVIGVVADVHTVRLEEAPPPMVYVPYWDGVLHQGNVWGNATYVLRTPHDPNALAGSFRRAVREPTRSFRWPTCGRSEMSREHPSRDDDSTHWWQASSLCQHCFSPARRVRRDRVFRRVPHARIGLRMALGAPQLAVLRQILFQGMTPVLGGLVLGVSAALWTGRLMSGLVFGVDARDPTAIAAVASMLAFAGVAACWLPARRASLIDPANTLRQD